MVMVKVVGGDAGGNDSDGGPKKTGIEQRVATVTATFIFLLLG